MTLEQLRIFVAVAEREHMTQAAGMLHLTQAAVSASITALERQHAVALFDRVGRGVTLTAAGRLFLAEARAVLARASTAAAVLDDFGSLRRGRLTLHASQTIASYLLPGIMASFHARHPGLALDLAIGNTAQVARAVQEGMAELGFVEGPLQSPELLMQPVAEDRMAIIVPAQHSWASGAPLTPEELQGASWVFREPGSGTRNAFVAGLAELGVAEASLNIVLTLPSNEAVREAVAAGAGVASLSPLVCVQALAAGTIKRANVLLPPRTFYAVRHRERYVTKAATAFLQAVVDANQTAA